MAIEAQQPQASSKTDFDGAASDVLGKRLSKENGLPIQVSESASQDQAHQAKPASTPTGSETRKSMLIQPTHSPSTLQRSIQPGTSRDGLAAKTLGDGGHSASSRPSSIGASITIDGLQPNQPSDIQAVNVSRVAPPLAKKEASTDSHTPSDPKGSADYP